MTEETTKTYKQKMASFLIGLYLSILLFFGNLGYDGDDVMPELDRFIFPEIIEKLIGQANEPQSSIISAHRSNSTPARVKTTSN